MSIERTIVQRLFESKGLVEAEFSANGHTYKCVFGKYYQDDQEITRDDYYKAKDGGSVASSTSSGSTNSNTTAKDTPNKDKAAGLKKPAPEGEGDVVTLKGNEQVMFRGQGYKRFKALTDLVDCKAEDIDMLGSLGFASVDAVYKLQDLDDSVTDVRDYSLVSDYLEDFKSKGAKISGPEGDYERSVGYKIRYNGTTLRLNVCRGDVRGSSKLVGKITLFTTDSIGVPYSPKKKG